MTKKLAVFVEGYTEQEFVVRLLTELAGKREILFNLCIQNRGHLSFVEFRKNDLTTPFIHVLVANCCNDKQVKSQILDHYRKLEADGYSLIIGLRDIYPFTHADIIKLEQSLMIGLPVGNVPINLHLAMMEIEAWFLEEVSHFSRIDTKITTNELAAKGFEPNAMRAHDLPHPANTLDEIYKTVGKRYDKKRSQRQRTIDALSYEELYVNTRQKAASLDRFIHSLESGLFAE